MKNFKTLTIGAAMFLTTLGQAQDPTKVKVYHKTGKGDSVLIEVSIFALPAHLLHGDVIFDDGGDDGGDGCLDC